jgi:hypothetical protein
MVECVVVFEVRIEFLNFIYMSFFIKGLMNYYVKFVLHLATVSEIIMKLQVRELGEYIWFRTGTSGNLL